MWYGYGPGLTGSEEKAGVEREREISAGEEKKPTVYLSGE